MNITARPIFMIAVQYKDGRVGVVAEHGVVVTFASREEADVRAGSHAATLGPDYLVTTFDTYAAVTRAAKEAFGC